MDFDKMKVSELKAECTKQGLPVGGLKAELLDRLKAAVPAPAPADAASPAPAPAPAPPTISEQHAFLDAAKAFNFAKVKQLIMENPAYTNSQPSGRWTAIHQAGLAGDVDMVKWLIKRGADLKCTNTAGQTPQDVAKPECKALLTPPAGGKQKAPAQGGAPPKSQKVSMKGNTAQVRYAGTGGKSGKSGGQVQQVVKGRAAVDASCPHADEMHVYEEGGDVYDALLNQADIGENKNKYYIIQLLETDASPHQYYTWNRWGRVGEERALQNAWRGPMSLQAAKADHCARPRVEPGPASAASVGSATHVRGRELLQSGLPCVRRQKVPRQDQKRLGGPRRLRAEKRQVHAARTRLRHRRARGAGGGRRHVGAEQAGRVAAGPARAELHLAHRRCQDDGTADAGDRFRQREDAAG